MPIADKDRAKLLRLARRAVEAEVREQEPPKVENPAGTLAEMRGCFVTLTNRGQLRGCIGTFQPQEPLGRQVCEMAAAAAKDPRFTMNPITPAELSELKVEISVLSPLEKTDDPQSLQVGTHGIYIVRGWQGGCFLPEVATEMGWTAAEFLDNCCTSKAHLPAGAWRDKDTKAYLFTSEKFGD